MKLRYIILKGAMLIALCVAGVESATAQQDVRITSDETDPVRGVRKIHTSLVIGNPGIPEKFPTVSMFLEKNTYRNELMEPALCLYIWYLDETPFAIPDGGTILLKLSDGTVLELENILFTSDTMDKVGSYFETYGRMMYINQAKILVTPAIVKAISEKGIVKIRTQLHDGFQGREYFDKEYSTPQFKNDLQTSYDLIEATLATKSGDIRERF